MSDTTTAGQTDILTLEAATVDQFPSLRIVAVLTDANGVPVPGSDPLGVVVSDIVTQAAALVSTTDLADNTSIVVQNGKLAVAFGSAANVAAPGTTVGVAAGAANAAAAAQALAATALPLSTYPSAPTVSGPFSGKPVIQMTERNGGAFGLGSGPVPITLTLPVAVAYLEYQIVDATSGAVIEAWQPYNGSVRPGVQTIYPIVSTRLGWNFIQVRANGVVGSIATSTVPFGVGDNILCWGQSLIVTKFSTFITGDTTTIASLGITISPYGSCFASWAQHTGATQNYPPVWGLPGDDQPYNSAFAAKFLSLMVAKAGYNIGLVGLGVGSSAISEWLPGQAVAPLVHLPVLLDIIQQGITGWAVELREIGHGDALLATSDAVFRQSDYSVRNAIELQNSVRARTLMQTIPGLGPYQSATPPIVSTIRNAIKQMALADFTAEYVDDLNATLWTDLVHPSQAGGVISAQNCYRAAAKLLGLLPVGSLGPYISGTATRSSTAPTTITIPITMQQRNSSIVTVGDLTTQFKVFLASDTALANALTISSVSVTTSAITIVLASDLGVGLPLQVWVRPGTMDNATSIAAGIFDNCTDGDGITAGRQLVDPGVPLSVAGTVPALTVNEPTGVVAGSALTLTGSYFGTQPVTPTLTVAAISNTTAGTAINLNGTYSGGGF